MFLRSSTTMDAGARLDEPPDASASDNEPRRSPPGGNDPSPHGSLDLRGAVISKLVPIEFSGRKSDTGFFADIFFNSIGVFGSLDEINRSTLDDVGPVDGDKGEKFLRELNEMADLEGNAGPKENPDR
jgi:hypothetical protein